MKAIELSILGICAAIFSAVTPAIANVENLPEGISRSASDLLPQQEEMAQKPLDLEIFCQNYPFNSRCIDRPKQPPQETPEPLEQQEETSQESKTRGYVGATGGAVFPTFGNDEVDFDPAFGGSVFGGVQFNKNLAIDGEFVGFTGSFEDKSFNIDGDYSGWGIFVNPRFILPLGSDAENAKFSLFVSPGIGFSQFNVNDGTEDFSDSSFALQVKAGANFKISKNFDIFLQGRYMNLLDLTFVPTDGDVSFFSPELGFTYKF